MPYATLTKTARSALAASLFAGFAMNASADVITDWNIVDYTADYYFFTAR